MRARGYDPEAHDPWYFPSMEDYVKVRGTNVWVEPTILTITYTYYIQLLVSSGFRPTHMSLTPRITPLASGLYEWLELFVRHSFFKDLPDTEAREIMEEVVEQCRIDCQDKSGKWAMVYMRLRFSAIMN